MDEIMVVASFVTMLIAVIISMVFYFKSKKTENKMFFQSLSVTVFWLVLSIDMYIVENYVPLGEQESYNMGVGFGFAIPAGILMIASSVVMGIAGLIASTNEKNNWFMISSVLAVSVIIPPLVIHFFLIPVVCAGVIVYKIKRKIVNKE